MIDRAADHTKYDLLIRNCHILTMDQEWIEYKSGLILIKDGLFEYIGPDDLQGEIRAEKIIDANGGLVMPAFINGHTHSAMSMFRGMGSDQPLNTWLNDFIWPAEAKYTNKENVYLGSMVSVVEMIKNGTGAFVDMYFFQEETIRACEEIGIRIVAGEGILDFPTPNKKTPADGLKYTEYLFEKYKNRPLISFSLPAHAPYTCSPDVLGEIGRLAQKLGIPTTIHLAETKWEDGEMKKRYGKSSTKLLADVGFFEGNSVAYHCNHLSDEDITLLSEHKVGIVTNPSSNMKLASGICPVPKLMNSDLTIGIGTDGAATNNHQSVLLDMQLLARIHKMDNMDPTVLKAKDVLRMAILNNASIYGLDDKIGSLETGKLADLIIIDTNQAHWQPMNDPYSQIVYSMQPDDVSHTIINGKTLMENGLVLGVNESQIIESIKKLGQEMS